LLEKGLLFINEADEYIRLRKKDSFPTGMLSANAPIAVFRMPAATSATTAASCLNKENLKIREATFPNAGRFEKIETLFYRLAKNSKTG
jgi:hypothetical protein